MVRAPTDFGPRNYQRQARFQAACQGEVYIYETQVGQVYRSVPGCDDVGPDLLQRYDVTGLGRLAENEETGGCCAEQRGERTI
jgi:hypothetical protein